MNRVVKKQKETGGYTLLTTPKVLTSRLQGVTVKFLHIVLRPGVDIDNLCHEMKEAVWIASEIWSQAGQAAVVVIATHIEYWYHPVHACRYERHTCDLLSIHFSTEGVDQVDLALRDALGDEYGIHYFSGNSSSYFSCDYTKRSD